MYLLKVLMVVTSCVVEEVTDLNTEKKRPDAIAYFIGVAKSNVRHAKWENLYMNAYDDSTIMQYWMSGMSFVCRLVSFVQQKGKFST